MSFSSERAPGRWGSRYLKQGWGENFPERDIDEGLGRISIETIRKPTEDDAAVVDCKIKDLTCIGSYSWVDELEPTIIVPGAPPIWIHRELPYRVQLDSGATRYIDQNGFRVPSSPFLPAFRAVDILEDEVGTEKIDWSSVDIVTDRNNLRKLLQWINGLEKDGKPPKDFRIDTQLGGKRTVLFNRWGSRTVELPTGFTGYGYNFEKMSTKPVYGCAGATGHHRIIKYDFDGLVLVVRFEVDACLDPTSDRFPDLAELLSGLDRSFSPPSYRLPERPSGKDINVIHAGCIVAQKDIIELKARSQRNAFSFDWDLVYPQLFLSQTPHLFLAIHNRGVFEEVHKEVLGSPKMKMIERELSTGLKKLRSALQTIQNLVIHHGKDGRLTLVYQEGQLEVYNRESNQSCLPTDIMARFEK